LISKFAKDHYVHIYLIKESKKLAKYNAALRLNNKINFEDNLDFLSSFVENARKNGAK
jgi:hypothetical protein